MSKKNNPRRPARPAHRPLTAQQQERLIEDRAQNDHNRFVRSFEVVAPVAERLFGAVIAYASTEAGMLAADRADRLVRDAASSALGGRLLGAIIGHVEKSLDLEHENDRTRQDLDLDRLKREHARVWQIEPVPAPEPVVEPEPAPEPEPVSKRRKINLDNGGKPAPEPKRQPKPKPEWVKTAEEVTAMRNAQARIAELEEEVARLRNAFR